MKEWAYLYGSCLFELERLEELLDRYQDAGDKVAFRDTWDLYCEEINKAVVLARRAISEGHYR